MANKRFPDSLFDANVDLTKNKQPHFAFMTNKELQETILTTQEMICSNRARGEDPTDLKNHLNNLLSAQLSRAQMIAFRDKENDRNT